MTCGTIHSIWWLGLRAPLWSPFHRGREKMRTFPFFFFVIWLAGKDQEKSLYSSLRGICLSGKPAGWNRVSLTVSFWIIGCFYSYFIPTTVLRQLFNDFLKFQSNSYSVLLYDQFLVRFDTMEFMDAILTSKFFSLHYCSLTNLSCKKHERLYR